MNCNNFKEWIMTDYVDSELAPEKQKLLEAHLKDCPACRSLAVGLKESAEILAGSDRVVLDRERIWKKVMEGIGEKSAPSIIYEPLPRPSPTQSLLRRFKPALVFVSLVLVVLLSALYVQRRPIQTVNPQEQEEEIEYLAYVVDSVEDDPDGDGFGTSLEDYFL